MKIIVIDDEADVESLFRQRFRKELKAGQLEIEFSFSAEAALKILRSQEFPSVVLILSDINMPGMSGLELLKILKHDFPTLKVFMITAYGDEQNYQAAIAYGADDFINKPVNFDQLKQKILSLESLS